VARWGAGMPSVESDRTLSLRAPRRVAAMPGTVPPVADERAGLLAFLAQQRAVIRIAAHGLTDEQARATPAASALSVGGLIKHVALTEQGWIDTVLQLPGDGAGADDD